MKGTRHLDVSPELFLEFFKNAKHFYEISEGVPDDAVLKDVVITDGGVVRFFIESTAYGAEGDGPMQYVKPMVTKHRQDLPTAQLCTACQQNAW